MRSRPPGVRYAASEGFIIIDQFAMVGREVEIRKKDKKNFGKVESAFLKDKIGRAHV